MPGPPPTPVQVLIDTGTDPAAHLAAFGRELVADRLPYGLQHLEDHGFAVSFLPPRRTGLVTRVAAEVGRRATLDLNPYSLLEGTRARRRAAAVLAWEERVGLPVAAGRRLGEPPCVTGLIWLTDRTGSLPGAYRRALRGALSRCAGVFVLSSAQVAPLVEDWGVDPSLVRYVPFGVPTEHWGAPGDAERRPELVVSAGNDWDRDHGLLVGAVADLRGRGVDVHLELLTERPVPVPPDVGRRRRAGGAADVRDAYRRAGLVAVATRPNLHASGMTVALEAMAAGRAVVVSATPGMEGYVEDGVTGLLVPPGDRGALADAIATLRGDPALASRLGDAAGRRVAEAFTSRRMGTDLAAMLRAAL